MAYLTKSEPDNPFGKWTKHRATIAALNRADAHDEGAETEARRLLKAARLADLILRDRESLTPEQRGKLARLLTHRIVGEAGPEAIVPLDRGQGGPVGSEERAQ